MPILPSSLARAVRSICPLTSFKARRRTPGLSSILLFSAGAELPVTIKVSESEARCNSLTFGDIDRWVSSTIRMGSDPLRSSRRVVSRGLSLRTVPIPTMIASTA